MPGLERLTFHRTIRQLIEQKQPCMTNSKTMTK